MSARRFAASGVSGLVFGFGLILSGMTDPRKVQSFLDLGGRWDPSLALVMVGAIAVAAVGSRIARARRAPIFEAQFHLPLQRAIDRRLVAGSAIFGVGWGLGGFCPGPAIVALGGLARGALPFVVAMIVGMHAVDAVDEKIRRSTHDARRRADDDRADLVSPPPTAAPTDHIQA
jgi:uncharacterized membrane protein YedE/YeeE